MGRQWDARRQDFKAEPAAGGRLYNEGKFKELYSQFDEVCEYHKGLEGAKTLKRVVVEEVTNIVQHNKTWMWIKVRTDFSKEVTNIKVTIQYSGTDYYDPKAHGVTNVIGSIDKFETYERKMERVKVEGEDAVDIRLQFKPSRNF